MWLIEPLRTRQLDVEVRTPNKSAGIEVVPERTYASCGNANDRCQVTVSAATSLVDSLKAYVKYDVPITGANTQTTAELRWRNVPLVTSCSPLRKFWQRQEKDYDIVPIKPELRHHLAQGSILEFPFEVVESMLAFRANDVVGRIAPRPLLLIHPANDTVTPTEQSIDLFLHAGQPTDLHLVAGTDHFIFNEGNRLVVDLVRDWLAQHFPAR